MMSNGVEKYNNVGVVTMKLYKIGKKKYIYIQIWIKRK